MSEKILNYPVGIGSEGGIDGQPYMLLTSYESKNAVDSVGSSDPKTPRGKIISSIALYIPPNALRTAFTADWGEGEGATVKAAGISAADRMRWGNIWETLGAGVKSAGLTGFEKVAAGFDKGTGMISAGGRAVNNHIGLIYKGPGSFRTHDFTFNFFPKVKNDSDVIREILKDLQNGMLPRMSGDVLSKGRAITAPFFLAPRHWTIDFFAGAAQHDGYLFQIGKSVIKSMSVNHDPNSTVSLHKDGAPVQTSLSISFQEIELPFSNDAVTDNKEEASEALVQNAQKPPKMNPITKREGSPSDYRLKDNITLLQEEGFGIPNIYSFNYKWDTETTWIGVMAQELFDIGYSDAVGIDSEGFYNVDYSRLGFPMIGFK